MPRTSARRHHNLPAQRVRLIGREHDLQVACDALLGTDGRLLTLTGSGGCGKTRLALEVASVVHPRFDNGVVLVVLADIANPVLVVHTIASALSIRERADESLTATVVRVLASLDLLLVLDNCEHLIDACARVTEELLDACPRLRVLATSREPLRIPGEKTWRVPSLALPDQHAATEAVLRSPAVELFVERAQAASSELALVPSTLNAISRICTRLDGMPLAIELAAARVRALSVEQIHERLDDSIGLLVGGGRTTPSRQQALRATLDWSYRLLGDSERAVLRRMAVFSESCSLEALEAVCAFGEDNQNVVLDLVTGLVDKSLVVVEQRDGQARYRLLEPVRQYAHELLLASGERDGVCRRYAEHYQAFAAARAYETNFGGPGRFVATNELRREYPNIRGVLAWSVETGEPQVGLSVAGSLLFFWQHHSSVSEGIPWVDQLLAMPGAGEPTSARAGALLSASYLAMLRGDLDKARAFSHEALALGTRLGEPLLEWNGLHFLGVVSYARGDLKTAQDYLWRAVPVAHAASAVVPEATSLGCVGHNLCDQADYATALELVERAYRLGRGDPWFGGWMLLVTGQAALGLGTLERARSALEAALTVMRQHGEPHSLTPAILDALGELEIACNRPRLAREWLASSLELRHASGERFMLARTFDQHASLAALCADPERALKLAGAADRIYEDLGGQRTPSEKQKLERWLVPLRDRFGSESAEVARTEGRALDLDDAVAFARGGGEPEADGPAPSAAPRAGSPLTVREQEVATLLARGLSNRQIAHELVISLHTAQRHVENILGKLSLSSRAQVASWAIGQRMGPVSTPHT
jgi:predicted ATPase/DNA-binding CsgD family transcriptional regulator